MKNLFIIITLHIAGLTINCGAKASHSNTLPSSSFATSDEKYLDDKIADLKFEKIILIKKNGFNTEYMNLSYDISELTWLLQCDSPLSFSCKKLDTPIGYITLFKMTKINTNIISNVIVLNLFNFFERPKYEIEKFYFTNGIAPNLESWFTDDIIVSNNDQYIKHKFIGIKISSTIPEIFLQKTQNNYFIYLGIGNPKGKFFSIDISSIRNNIISFYKLTDNNK